jgi:hypothetical protein
MLSTKVFAQRLKDFETTYEKCLKTLASLTSGNASTEPLARFQPSLYHSLLQLTRGYHEIRRERERLVARKDRLTKAWHDKRQRVLAERQEILMRAIRMGRTLGDAFVWFFYRDDPALLQEHARQPPPSLPPAGDGGEGELALIDAVRFFGDKYILFHGITTMFRLGDASLADLTTHRIVGIGELKTTRIDEKTLNMHFQASVQPGLSFKTTATVPTSTKMPPPEQLARLNKQMSRISRAAASADRPPQAKMDIQVGEMAHVQDLNTLVAETKAKKVAMRQVSPGLVILAYRSGQRTLRSRLRDITSVPKSALVGMEELARSIRLEGSPHNMLIVSRAFYSDTWEPVILAGASPMLMWHLEPEVKRAVATGAVVVATLFNPAHIFKNFVEQGWSFERFKPPANFSLKRQRGNGKTIEIGNLQYFLQLVAGALYREDYVVRLLTETWIRVEAEDLTGERIDLNLTHHVYF